MCIRDSFKGDEWELYNIKEDRTEQHNLIGKYPEMAKELETAYFESPIVFGPGAPVIVRK